jgi:hypothetical protein
VGADGNFRISCLFSTISASFFAISASFLARSSALVVWRSSILISFRTSHFSLGPRILLPFLTISALCRTRIPELVVIQTVGKKKWTLVLPEYSHLIRPTISPDGRAYFYSAVDPFDSHGLDHVPHYEFITEEGDLLYVPTWTWHRIDYLPNETAVSLSIFQFIPKDYLIRNFVFAFALIPNLIKEAIGMKEQ